MYDFEFSICAVKSPEDSSTAEAGSETLISVSPAVREHAVHHFWSTLLMLNRTEAFPSKKKVKLHLFNQLNDNIVSFKMTSSRQMLNQDCERGWGYAAQEKNTAVNFHWSSLYSFIALGLSNVFVSACVC